MTALPNMIQWLPELGNSGMCVTGCVCVWGGGEGVCVCVFVHEEEWIRVHVCHKYGSRCVYPYSFFPFLSFE